MSRCPHQFLFPQLPLKCPWIQNHSLIKYFDCILAFLLVPLIFLVDYCGLSKVLFVEIVVWIWSSEWVLFRKVLIFQKKPLPSFAPLVSSFAIVHQRSVISVIISENSSLLLIVWNNLKASGSYSFGWSPAHSNTEELFQVHINKKKKRVQETHRARTFWGGRGGDLQPWDESPSVEFSHSYNFSLFKVKRLPFSTSIPLMWCPFWNGFVQPHLMPCWKLDVLRHWHRAVWSSCGV